MKRAIATTAVGMVALMGLWPADAAAFSTGQFSRALATPDWTRGSFAGSVTWGDCNTGCKSYLVLIYNEPAVYTCDDEDWLEESDPNIHQVWNSGSQTVNRTITFEASNVALLPGIYGQRLCMIGIQQTETEFGTVVSDYLLASKVFEVEPPAQVPAAPPTSLPSAGLTPACKQANARIKRLHKRRRDAQNAGNKPRVQALTKSLKRALANRRVACR